MFKIGKRIFQGLSSLFAVSISLNVMAAAQSPWDDEYNVYKYFKKSDGTTCLYTEQDCSTLGAESVTQFKKVFHFSGDTYGLNQQTSVDVNGDGTLESVPKYSGNLSTYTTKHYPVAVKHSDGMVYFVYSGPAQLDGSSSYATTAGSGKTTTAPKFLDSNNKSRALGIYVAKYNTANDKVSQPVLVHVKFIDDPHDNAIINIDKDGYIYVLVAGRGQTRGAFLYRSTSPGTIDSFTDITPDNVDYTSFDSGFGVSGIAYPKMFWVDRGNSGYFRLIYTVYCSSDACGLRNIFSAKLNVRDTADGSLLSQANLGDIDRIAGFKGHYSIANAKGDDVVLAFNVHLNNNGKNRNTPDHRTNLYYMHSTDGGENWKNAANQSVSIPMLTETSLDQVAAREYYHNSQTVQRRIYIKDINFSGTGDAKKPMILYVGVIGTNGHQPSTTADHYLAKAFHDGSSWSQARISNDVDHNYSSGMLVSDGGNTYDVYFPGTPEAENNGLGGGALAKTYTDSSLSTQYNVTYMTPSESQADFGSAATYFNRMCEFNYIRAIHGNDSKTGLVGITAAGNPYQWAYESSANPIVMVKHNGYRMLRHSFSASEVSNGFVITLPNAQLICDPNRGV